MGKNKVMLSHFYLDGSKVLCPLAEAHSCKRRSLEDEYQHTAQGSELLDSLCFGNFNGCYVYQDSVEQGNN